jgi:hypothetical protein
MGLAYSLVHIYVYDHLRLRIQVRLSETVKGKASFPIGVLDPRH